MIVKIFFAILILFASFSSIAQPNLDWVSTSPSPASLSNDVEDVFVDDSGNTYACGSFRGTIEFGSYTFSTFGNTRQCFVVKYDDLGLVQWAISSSGDNATFGHSIYVDANDAVYVGGHHSSTTTTFGGVSINSTAEEEFFVLKLSPSGVPVHILGPDFISNGRNQVLAITGEGNKIYIAGFYEQTPIAINGISTQTPAQEDIFVAGLDTSFTNINWVNSHGSSRKDRATGITVDGADVFVTGYYGRSTCTFADIPTDYVLPNYNKRAIWLMNCASSDGAVGWATSAGGPNKNSLSKDIVAAGGNIYITGIYADTCRFVSTPATSAPFIYNDTLISNGGTDALVGKYDYSGNLLTVWSEGGTANDTGEGITFDTSCNEIQVCGTFRSTVNFGGSTTLTANSKDVFISSYDPAGAINWAFKETSSGKENASKIYANNGKTSFGGNFNEGTYFGTSPIQLLNNFGVVDHFVASFQCANILPCGPEIICPLDDTVTADLTCNYILTDYIGTEVVFDNCGTGFSVSQSPPLGTAVTAGIYPITMTVLDVAGNSNICQFDLAVEADVNPILVNCGDQFTNQTTLNQGNTTSNFSCTSSTTPGEDVYYQVTIPSGNHFLYVTMDNVSDPTDSYVNTFWVESNCPVGGSCDSADSLNVSSGKFSNGSNTQSFLASGPGTYFFVVDSKNDNIEEYDIAFDCLVSGIEFDSTGCSSQDSNNDGVVAFVNGSTVLDIEPCETVTICHDVYIRNVKDWEWMDSVQMELGPCYTNINVTSITPNSPPVDNGFYDQNGEWDAIYDLNSNSITWEFTSSTGNPWGDGNSGLYGCNLYTFCFEADITAACTSSDSLSVSITVVDDGLPLGEVSAGGFASVLSRDFNLLIPDPNFSYPDAQYCQNETNPTPAILGTSVGTFTATAGIVFTDGSPSATGIVDLLASSIGPHTVTYSLGNCPVTQTFNLLILVEDDATFSYSVPSFCKENPDPTPIISGLAGGSFSEITGDLDIDPSSGLIDLNASINGTYWVVYTTNGNCPIADSVQVTINPMDDPTFYYPAAIFCQEDTDPTPIITGLAGGLFSETTGNLDIDLGSGLIDLSTSIIGTYWVVYTTNGNCPNADSVQVTINPLDDATFSYSVASFCQEDIDPTPIVTGLAGGLFSEITGNLSINTNTGLIDLGASISGTYWVVYITNGTCINTDSVQVTINQEDDPSFDYATNNYCPSGNDPTPIITGALNGIFTEITGNLSIISSSGQIDLSASTPGTYWVVYTTTGICPNVDSMQITINALDDASFNYSAAAFCKEDIAPNPTITGVSGGLFYENTGNLTIETVSGLVDLSTSAPGTYWVVYSSSDICPNTDSTQITINAEDIATITYSSNTFCKEETDPLPNIPVTSGGVFSEASGNLTISSSTGLIDLGLSISGFYWVVYTTFGICPNIDSTQVTINSEDDASFTIDDVFCLEDTNPTPVISGTSGGMFNPSSNISLNPSTGEINLALTNPGGPYEYEYVTNGACSDSSSMFITFYPPPIADAGPDQSIGFQPSTILSGQLPSNETGNWFSFDESITFSDINDPNTSINNLMPNTYELEWIVTNEVCPSVKDTMIIVVADIFIPQAITPNNDGDNDLFELNINSDVECSLEIFNRWGQVEYKNTNYQNDWGGNNMKGTELSNDTYFYVIEINQNTRYKGYVVIKR